MLKRIEICFVVVLIIAVLNFALPDTVFKNSIPINSESVIGKKTIIVDAGHGGFDGGAVATDGTIEKDLNLAIALKLNSCLKFLGFKTVLVRSEDYSMEGDMDGATRSKKVSDIKNRIEITEKYDNAILISIHMNKYSTTQPNGTQVFYGLANGSKELANSIQTSVKEGLQPYNNRVVKKTTKDIYLLYHSKIPSVIVECGFLSNNDDLKNLKSDEYQKSISWAIAAGVMNYLETSI